MAKSVAIIGSCQIGGVGYALKRCSPDLDVWFLNPATSKVTEAELVAQALSADSIVTQDVGPVALHSANLRKMHDDVHFLPVFAFRGFHPDCAAYFDEGKPLPGVLGANHSTIVSCCYALGIPENQTKLLFNTLVFRALGYFEAFSIARAQTLDRFRQCGFDIQSRFDRWMSFGSFMHTSNHPRIEILMELGEMLSVRLGMHLHDLDSRVFGDNLRALGVWPFYPELAQPRGMEGSVTFLLPTGPGKTREAPMESMVADSYRTYATLGREKMAKTVASPKMEILRRLLRP